MYWLSSEAEINLLGAYENGFAAEAVAAVKKMVGYNPWHGCYRESILYGSLLPVLKQGSKAGCQLIESGTVNGHYYSINNNPEEGLEAVSTTTLGANGQLAYQAIDDFIRGGKNYEKWIETIEKEWDGKGFKVGAPNGEYTSRSFGAAGCAILVCNYDPLGIFPAMDEVVSQLQGPSGSFPNQYSTVAPGERKCRIIQPLLALGLSEMACLDAKQKRNRYISNTLPASIHTTSICSVRQCQWLNPTKQPLSGSSFF